jgi:DNA repair photolyase
MKVAQAGYFTSFHEPFNDLEPIYHNTQAGATAFVEAGLPIFFLSRASYPDWAIDLLRKSPFSYAQKSLNTPDEDDWRKLSPRGLPLHQHLEEIRKLREAGIYVSIQCNPVIGGIVTHDDIERLFERLAAAGANHVIVKFVEANHPWVGGMVERMTKAFGANRAAYFKELFVEKQSGAQTTILEEYRREGHTRYRKKATELGMTYSLCYEYTRREDGRWVSMGPEFLTAEQCHGHRVPFFRRSGPRFVPLSVCPPSGCLTCGDSSGVGKCGSGLLGQALALKQSDFKREPGFTRV